MIIETIAHLAFLFGALALALACTTTAFHSQDKAMKILYTLFAMVSALLFFQVALTLIVPDGAYRENSGALVIRVLQIIVCLAGLVFIAETLLLGVHIKKNHLEKILIFIGAGLMQNYYYVYLEDDQKGSDESPEHHDYHDHDFCHTDYWGI